MSYPTTTTYSNRQAHLPPASTRTDGPASSAAFLPSSRAEVQGLYGVESQGAHDRSFQTSASGGTIEGVGGGNAISRQAYDPIAFERLIGLQSPSYEVDLPPIVQPQAEPVILERGYARAQQHQQQQQQQQQRPTAPVQHRATAAQSSTTTTARLPPIAQQAQPLAARYVLPPPTRRIQQRAQDQPVATRAPLGNKTQAQRVQPASQPHLPAARSVAQVSPSSHERAWSSTAPTQGAARQRQPAGPPAPQPSATTSHQISQQQQREQDSWESRRAASGSGSIDAASNSHSEEDEDDSGSIGSGSDPEEEEAPRVQAGRAGPAPMQAASRQQQQTQAQVQRQAQNSRYAGQMAKVPVDMSSELTGSGPGRTASAGKKGGRPAARATPTITKMMPANQKGKQVDQAGVNASTPGTTATIAATLGANMASTPVKPGQAPVGRQVPRSGAVPKSVTNAFPVPAAGSVAAPLQIPGSHDPPPEGSLPAPSTASVARGRGGKVGARGRGRGRGGIAGVGVASGRGTGVGAAARGRGAMRGRGGPPGRAGPPPPPKPALRTLFQHAQAYVEKDIGNDVPSADVDVSALIARQKQLIEEAEMEAERERLIAERRIAQAGSDGGDDFGPGGFDFPRDDGNGSEIDFSDSNFDVEFESDDSDYERSRQRRIEQNKLMMEQLGLGNADSYRLPDGNLLLKKRRGRKPGSKNAAGDSQPRKRGRKPKYRPAEYDADGTTFDFCDKGERQRAAYVEIKPVFRSERIAGTYTYTELPPVPENPREPDPSDVEGLPLNDDWWWLEPVKEDKPDKRKKPRISYRERPSDAPGEMCHQCRRRSYKPMMICTAEAPFCRRRFCISCVESRYNFPFDDADTNWLCPVCVDNCNCSNCLRASGRIDLIKDQVETLAQGSKRINYKAITKTINFQKWLEQLGAPKVLPREEERINAVRFIIQSEDVISPEIPDDVYDGIMYPHKKKPVSAEPDADEPEQTPTRKKRKSRKSTTMTNGDGEVDSGTGGGEAGPKRKRVRIVELDEAGNPIKKKAGRPKNKPQQAAYDADGVFQGEYDEYGYPIELDGYGEPYAEEEEEGDEFERTYGYQRPAKLEPNSAGYLFGGSFATYSTSQAVPVVEPAAASEVFDAALDTPVAPMRPKPQPRKRVTKAQRAEAAAAIAATQLHELGPEVFAGATDSELSSPAPIARDADEYEHQEDHLPEAADLERSSQPSLSRRPPSVLADVAASSSSHLTPAAEGRAPAARAARGYTPITTVEESVRYAQQKRREADAILARQGGGSGYGSGYGY